MGDDYWHGTNVVTNGFWGDQLKFYLTWEGSFTHTFLATIPHVFSCRHMPFVVNMVTLLVLVLSVYSFIKAYYIEDRRMAFMVSIFMTALYYVVTGCGAEIRFWICGNGPYLFGVSTLLILMAFYHKLQKPTLFNLLPLWACLVLIVGNKVSYIICLFACMITHDVAYDSFSKRKITLFYLPAALLSIINVVAPGNYVRLSENMGNAQAIPLVEVLVLRFIKIAPAFLYALFVPPFFDRKESSALNGKFLMAILFGAMAFFLLDSLCMYFCFRDPGPLRTCVLSEIWFLIAGMVVRDYVVRRVGFKFVDMNFYGIAYGLILCVSQLSFIGQVPATIHYAQEAQARNSSVKAQFGSKTIRVPELPPSHLLLSYFANDIIWIKNVYLPYFRMADCEVQLLNIGER